MQMQDAKNQCRLGADWLEISQLEDSGSPHDQLLLFMSQWMMTTAFVVAFISLSVSGCKFGLSFGLPSLLLFFSSTAFLAAVWVGFAEYSCSTLHCTLESVSCLTSLTSPFLFLESIWAASCLRSRTKRRSKRKLNEGDATRRTTPNAEVEARRS